jgi:hypothetical protein
MRFHSQFTDSPPLSGEADRGILNQRCTTKGICLVPSRRRRFLSPRLPPLREPTYANGSRPPGTLNAPHINGTVKILNRLLKSRLHGFTPTGAIGLRPVAVARRPTSISPFALAPRQPRTTLSRRTSLRCSACNPPITAFNFSSSPDNLRFSPTIPNGGWPRRTAHEVPTPRSPRPCRRPAWVSANPR